MELYLLEEDINVDVKRK